MNYELKLGLMYSCLFGFSFCLEKTSQETPPVKHSNVDNLIFFFGSFFSILGFSFVYFVLSGLY